MYIQLYLHCIPIIVWHNHQFCRSNLIQPHFSGFPLKPLLFLLNAIKYNSIISYHIYLCFWVHPSALLFYVPFGVHRLAFIGSGSECKGQRSDDCRSAKNGGNQPAAVSSNRSSPATTGISSNTNGEFIVQLWPFISYNWL